MSSDKTVFSGNATANAPVAAQNKSSSLVLGGWFRSNSNNSNSNNTGTSRIDLEKREGSKKTTAADVINNNNASASRTESVTDNCSVYSSNSAFTAEGPPVGAAAVAGVVVPSSDSPKVPQDGVDGASVLGRYHIDIQDDESRISLAHDNNNNNNNSSVHSELTVLNPFRSSSACRGPSKNHHDLLPRDPRCRTNVNSRSGLTVQLAEGININEYIAFSVFIDLI
ncbi:hypothetical protein BGZ47_001408 [Haplosporangium gracile]|nr:hypothetical protein BGZ47_001408 [Haplosporangium gracile]